MVAPFSGCEALAQQVRRDRLVRSIQDSGLVSSAQVGAAVDMDGLPGGEARTHRAAVHRAGPGPAAMGPAGCRGAHLRSPRPPATAVRVRSTHLLVTPIVHRLLAMTRRGVDFLSFGRA